MGRFQFETAETFLPTPVIVLPAHIKKWRLDLFLLLRPLNATCSRDLACLARLLRRRRRLGPNPHLHRRPPPGSPAPSLYFLTVPPPPSSPRAPLTSPGRPRDIKSRPAGRFLPHTAGALGPC